MSEVKDPAFKLFGKTIPFPTSDQVPVLSFSCNQDDNINTNKEPTEIELTKQKEGFSVPTAKDSIDPATSHESPKTRSRDKENSSPETSKNEEQSETSAFSQEKTLKKPDKILPCPRCSSMDTKFCYYNNYNVNQPRHFCKNCQRYWTAGGTMRNVPVGSGRRKNKSSSCSSYRQIMISEALLAARGGDAINGMNHPANGTVLAFGSDSVLCESIASALNLAEKPQSYEHKAPVSCGVREIGDDHSCGSTITASNSSEKIVVANGSLQESAMNHFRGFPPHLACFPGPPWPSPLSSGQWRPPMPQAPGFPISFYPSLPYWGCVPPNNWNMPWLSQPPPPPPPPPPASDHSAMTPSPNSPTLGKHSRENDALEQSNSERERPSRNNDTERCVLVPKTLRIDDPNEAAKSSIWSTLGIKNDKTNEGGLFKAFRGIGDEKNHIAQTSLVLQANPAAMSRSLNFHETTE